jgi:hypothetical protein
MTLWNAFKRSTIIKPGKVFVLWIQMILSIAFLSLYVAFAYAMYHD